MQTSWSILRRGVTVLAAHPRIVVCVGLVLAYATGHLDPVLGVFVIGAIQLDDVNTITTKDIMPGVADQ